MKIAIVHDYLFQYGGAENCVEKWLQMYPEAEVFTSFAIPEKFSESKIITKAFQEGRVHSSWMQRIFDITIGGNKPLLGFQKHLFWLYPIVMSRWTIRGFDTVIISSTFCAKNVKIGKSQQGKDPKVLYYCYTPTRFLHGLITETDTKTIHPILRKLIPFFTYFLKVLDLRAVKYLNQIGTHWIAISKFIQKNIQDIYHTESTIIYPPVNLQRFLGNLDKPDQPQNSITLKGLSIEADQNYYLYLGRISFHKRVDLIIESCLRLKKKLYIAGSTSFLPEFLKLQKIVTEYTKVHPEAEGLIYFLGRVSDEDKVRLLKNCKALVFPVKEDFGITPIEAFASGTPVIAYQEGGALEYVQDRVNGLFFPEQTVESLMQTLESFEATPSWDKTAIQGTSRQFSEEAFETSFRHLIEGI